MEKDKNKKPKETLIGRIELPTLFSDKMFLRATETEDGRCRNYIMSWSQKTMDETNQYIEQSRTMVTDVLFKKIIDLFCKTANYYPVQDDPEKGSKIAKPQNKK